MSPDEPVDITFTVRPAGGEVLKFRRESVESLRDAIAQTAMAGKLDNARAEELFRAFVVEDNGE